MMNDAAYVSPHAPPITISLDDIEDADDAAVTQVMPACPHSDVKRYLRATGLSFRTNVVLSMTLLTGVLAAIIAAHV